MRVGSRIGIHLSKLWNARFSILCDVIFLVRLQGKFEIDHSRFVFASCGDAYRSNYGKHTLIFPRRTTLPNSAAMRLYLSFFLDVVLFIDNDEIDALPGKPLIHTPTSVVRDTKHRQCVCRTNRWLLPAAGKCDAAEIRFSSVRSPRVRVSGHCTKWRIQGSFVSSSSHSLNVKDSWAVGKSSSRGRNFQCKQYCSARLV